MVRWFTIARLLPPLHQKTICITQCSPPRSLTIACVRFGPIIARFMQALQTTLIAQRWAMRCSMPQTHTPSQRKTKHTRFLSMSEFWSPLHTALKNCVHSTAQTLFHFSNNTSYQNLAPAPAPAPHLEYNLPDTQHPFPFETVPLPPPIDPYSDNFTTVNFFETYDAPVGIDPPADQSTTTTFISSSITPGVITKERWYTEYSVDRDAQGLFHCPFAGCSKENKRRDQLYEHWKAKHKDQPYRCTVW